MSWIMPPRPKRASRPVIVKSVTASTRVPPSCSVQRVDDRRRRAALAALVGPARVSVAVCVASSALSILIVPR